MVGLALAAGLVAVVTATQSMPAAGVPFSWAGIGVSLLLGIGVTVGASVAPALQAAGVSPLTALGGRASAGTGERRGPRQAVALAATVAVAAFLLAPVETRLLKALSLLVFFPLFIYVSALAISPLARIAATPIGWLSRSIGLMVESNIRHESARISITVAGFVMSLSLIVALSNGAASFSTAGQRWAQSLFPGEYLVVSPVSQPAESEIVAEFQAISGVEAVSPVSIVPIVWEGLYLAAAGVDPTYYFQAFDFQRGERVNAFRDMRRGPSVLVPARLAQERGLKIGDRMSLRAGDRQGDFTVAGIIAHSLPTADNYGALVLPGRDVKGLLGVSSFRFLAISAKPEADLSQLEGQLARTAELFGMESSSTADLRQAISGGVGGLLGLLAGLVVIGVVVGALSIVNTMTMSIALRARQIAILRADGMTRGSIQRLAMAEGAVMGFLGALLGIALGAFVTWIVVDLNRSADFEPQFTFSWPTELMILGVGIVVAALAAFYPAALAARTNIVAALRQE